jgi:hypothetical protein
MAISLQVNAIGRQRNELAANRLAHTAKAEEKRIARIPVTSKLGTIVIAGSPPTILKNADPGQDEKINPLGAMLP